MGQDRGKVSWAILCPPELYASGGVISGFHMFPGVYKEGQGDGAGGHVWVVAQVLSNLPVTALSHHPNLESPPNHHGG